MRGISGSLSASARIASIASASASRPSLVSVSVGSTEALGLTNLRFQEGDATDLDELDDEQFDLVVSIFGAMFAPKPFDVAKEMVRVTKPGGRIVMGNWIPNDPTLVAQILKISSSYAPPPPEGFISPMTWGVEDDVIERFTKAGVPEEQISFERDTYTFNYPGHAVGAGGCVPELLRADHERVRGGGDERSARPTSRQRWTPCSTSRTRAITPRRSRRLSCGWRSTNRAELNSD